MNISDQPKEFSVEIPRILNEERFDSALTTLVSERFSLEPPLSRVMVASRIKKGLVLLNGKKATPKTKVFTHDQIVILEDFFALSSQNYETRTPSSFPILFENDDFLLIEKPAGVEVHPSGVRSRETVTSWLLHSRPEMVSVGEDPKRPGIVHRLDRDTSGLLVIAKNQKSFEALKTAFQERLVQKTYLAFVYGHLSKLEGDVDASLFRKSGELKRRAIDPKTSSQELPGSLRTAHTSYRVLKRYEEYDLVELRPHTGRTHQLRVHMAFLGHPVVGDRLYAFKDVKRKKLLFPPRHLLHAAKLSFPLFGEKHEFSTPLPQDFREVLQGVDETLISSYDDEALKSLF